MRRTIFLALLATLLLAQAAQASDTSAILRDCQDDVLQGHYTVSELRKARSSMPTDLREYTDCNDVLARAISAASVPKSTGSGGGGGSASGGGGGGGGGTSGGGSGASPATTGGDSSTQATPDTQPERVALGKALTGGGAPVNVGGRPVVPGGASRLAADVGRNALPTTLLFVLALLAAAALAALAPLVRNRVVRHRQS